ncbi:MAG: FUSC family protein [Plesiomonas sp.]|uniref:FUSC family protein n=1 Tax=Plesiomonas sp. TaxID=2486279 RepID=UPI003F2DA5C4
MRLVDREFIFCHYRAYHALRVGLAFLLTLILLHYAPLGHSPWVLVTLLVVMSNIPYLGGVWQKGLHRILGTLIGAIAGLIALKLQLISPWIAWGWMSLMAMACGYYGVGKRPYVAMLCGITLAMIGWGGVDGTSEALWRAADVLIGTLLAILFSSLWPQRASRRWQLLLSDNLKAMAQLYQAHRSTEQLQAIDSDYAIKTIYDRAISMRPLLAPASREHFLSADKLNEIQSLLQLMLSTLELLVGTHKSYSEAHIHWELPKLKAEQMQVARAMNAQASRLRGLRASRPDSGMFETFVSPDFIVDRTDDRIPLSPFGYLWLNRELARQFTRLQLLLQHAEPPLKKDQPIRVEKSEQTAQIPSAEDQQK